MDLLHYEFIDGPDESINGMLRTLVQKLRYNRSMVSIDQFKQDLINLKRIEIKLQTLDQNMGETSRNYIEEIMSQLNAESERRDNLERDLPMALSAIAKSVYNREVDMAEFEIEIGQANNFQWLQFSGYAEGKETDANIIIAKEVCRAICYKYNYIFIDLS